MNSLNTNYPFNIEELFAFIERALEDKQFNGRFYYGELSTLRGANLMRMLTSIAIKPRIFIYVRASDVRHIFKHHGNEIQEKTNGQIAVTVEDFIFVWEAFEYGNVILPTGFAKGNGMPTIKVTLNAGKNIYIGEVLKDGGEFYLLTMFIKE